VFVVVVDVLVFVVCEGVLGWFMVEWVDGVGLFGFDYFVVSVLEVVGFYVMLCGLRLW